jgi:hypothetical protein
MRNGLIYGTKCQSFERKRNLFRLMCMALTSHGHLVMQRSMGLSNGKWKKIIEFLKLYIGMEEWFHDTNDEDKVKGARVVIEKVLNSLQTFFPRMDNTNGYNTPKMHGMTKFVEYMMLLGSAINFYGGSAEASHKIFVKAVGLKTQRRVSEFAQETANQYYHMMLTNYAVKSCAVESINCKQNGATELKTSELSMKTYDITIELLGRYQFILSSEMLMDMEERKVLSVDWHTDPKGKKTNNSTFQLNKDLVRVLHMKLNGSKFAKKIQRKGKVFGFTKAVMITSSNKPTSFYAHPCFQMKEWYDWAFVHFEERDHLGGTTQNYYHSKLLGFISTEVNTCEAVIQYSMQPLIWATLVNKFLVKFTLGEDTNMSYVTVPLEAIVHPLCVIPDIEGEPNAYFVILPKQNWS